LLPGVEDVRGFIWYARAQAPEISLEILPRYTAQIVNLQAQSTSTLFENFSRNRRRLLHRFEREGTPKIYAWRTQDCVRLYADVMKRQGYERVDQARVVAVERLCELVKQGLGSLYAYRLDGSQEIGALRLVLNSQRMTCYVLSAASDEARDQHIVSYLSYQSILAQLRKTPFSKRSAIIAVFIH